MRLVSKVQRERMLMKAITQYGMITACVGHTFSDSYVEHGPGRIWFYFNAPSGSTKTIVEPRGAVEREPTRSDRRSS